MRGIDWLVDRNGVMFAPESPQRPEDDAADGEAHAPQRRPSEVDNRDERDTDFPEMEVGDPRDGP